MGEITNDFITKFHNIQGETIKEKHQNLFHLLHENISLYKNPEELSFITTNLKPTTHLENIFRIDFLIYFRQFKELYEDFKNNHEITIRKLSRQDWFFQLAFEQVSSKEFVNSILPTISHSLKVKILKKLPLDEKHADEFFDEVSGRYGIFLATILLPKCTSRKIHKTITAYPIKLTVAQLEAICNKDSNLICVYFEERIKHEGDSKFMNDHPIWHSVAQKNPKMFSDFFKKYHFKTNLGRRTTKRFVDSQKTAILQDKEAFINILNKSATTRKIGSEMKEIFFRKLLGPKSCWDLVCPKPYWSLILKYYPKDQQFDIFKSTYNSIYHKKFGENIDDISEDMLKMIPDAEERELLATMKMEKEGEDLYLKYMRPKTCLKEVMEKINHTTVANRAKYIAIAADCCILNKNLVALQEIIEIVRVRFKNDDKQIRRSFLKSLRDNTNILDEFDEQNWNSLSEILAKATDEWIYWLDLLIKKYMMFLAKNNKSVKEVVWKYTKWSHVLSHVHLIKDMKVFRSIVTELIKEGLTKPHPTDEAEAELFDCYVASLCKTYNEKNPNDVINIFDNPRFVKSVKTVLEMKEITFVSKEYVFGIEYLVCRPSTSQELKKLYFIHLEEFKNKNSLGLKWFLVHEPKTIQDNFDEFLAYFTVCGGSTKKTWRLIKKYDYLDLDKRTIEFCKQKLSEEGFDSKEKLVKPLTMLSSPDSHLEFIKLYEPSSGKVDLTDVEARKLYSIQGNIVKCLHFLNSPETVLPVTLEFCKGDYLRFALGPLYSCMCKLPENETKTFINRLRKTKAVSVKKHEMRLACLICDTKTVHSCLKNTTVPSLIPALKHFRKNPSADLWSFIEAQINNVKKEELQLLKEAMKIKVPFAYKTEYAELIWNALERHGNNKKAKDLLKNFNKDVIQRLGCEFAFKILQKIIFKTKCDDLAANILIHLQADDKFKFLSDILTTFRKDCWDRPEMQRTSRHELNSFITSLFKNYMMQEEPNEKFSLEVTTLFTSIFSLSEAFEETIMLKCMVLKNETAENCSKILLKLNDILNKKYGTFIVQTFADTLNVYVFKFVFDSNLDKKLELCYSALKFKENVNDYLLIIQLLPRIEPKSEKQNKIYKHILTEITRDSDDIIQLQFNTYLKSISDILFSFGDEDEY